MSMENREWIWAWLISLFHIFLPSKNGHEIGYLLWHKACQTNRGTLYQFCTKKTMARMCVPLRGKSSKKNSYSSTSLLSSLSNLGLHKWSWLWSQRQPFSWSHRRFYGETVLLRSSTFQQTLKGHETWQRIGCENFPKEYLKGCLTYTSIY